MRQAGVFSILVFAGLLAGLLRAQDGQSGSRPGWPCVPGRAVDPSYLEVSEGTGGQLFLFQKGEVAHASVVMSASYTHPATILRAVGHLNGTRDFEFPVEASVESILVLASLQCRNAIQVSRPGGSEPTQANSALSIDLQAGRILRVDNPETGNWRLRLTGTGLFVLSVLAKAEIRLSGVVFSPDEDSRLRDPLYGVGQSVEARMSGQVSNIRIQLVDASGGRISDPETAEAIAEGVYRIGFTPRVERLRLVVTGTDGSAAPFQRMHPVLFRAQQPK